jgi:hypothetical protein
MEATVPPKRGLTFNGLHSVIPQKTELFKEEETGILELGEE